MMNPTANAMRMPKFFFNHQVSVLMTRKIAELWNEPSKCLSTRNYMKVPGSDFHPRIIDLGQIRRLRRPGSRETRSRTQGPGGQEWNMPP